MSLNAKETKHLTFTTKALNKRNTRLKLKIQGQIIAQAPTSRYIGITLDTHMTFNAHITGTERSARHKSYLLNRMNDNLEDKASVKIVKCMMVPAIEYSDLFYGVASDTRLRRLQTIMNGALETAYKVYTHIVT